MNIAIITFITISTIFLLFLSNAVDAARRVPKRPISGSKSSTSRNDNTRDNQRSGEDRYGSNDKGKNNDDDDKDDPQLNQLLEDIFGDYHKELVPLRPTIIKLDLLLLKVKSTIEKEGIFESVVALFMEWRDHRMTWNPKTYENVSVLAFDSDRVWLPDIAMTNSADHLYSISKDTRFVVRVTNDGIMKFVPTGTARTWCDLKLLTFPFDVQTVSLLF